MVDPGKEIAMQLGMTRSSPVRRLRAGRVGRYLVVDRLGAGGMAEVYRALMVGPERFHRVVVLKRILPHLTGNPSFVSLFLAEARICGCLGHPNLVQVYELGEHEGQYFIVMEYIEGRDLNDVMRRLFQHRLAMPPTTAAEIVRQACRGLAHAHGLTHADGRPLGIVHRDLSPDNLLVGYAGGVKVVDFGIARVGESGGDQPGFLKGKSAYLAPEQIARRPFDHRVDVFAMGIILHEILTGFRLFAAASDAESMAKIRSLPVVPPSSLARAVPPELDVITMRALSRRPADRYPTADAMADDLESFLLDSRTSSRELPTLMRLLFQPDIEQDRRVLLEEEPTALSRVRG